MIRVLLVDDQAMVREGFGALLSAQEDMLVVGDAADGEQAVAAARRHDPDVILMDIRMPAMDGLTATRKILSKPPGTHLPRVLMLTTFDLDEYVFEALRAGASGFLLKDASAAELVHGMRVVASGDALLAPSVTRRLIEDFPKRARPRRERRNPISTLTHREADVLRLVARGLSNQEIAAELVLAEQTVKTHVSHMLSKLRLRDRAQVVVYAYESGIVTAGE